MEIEASQIKYGGGKTLLFDLLDYLHTTNCTAIVWIGNMPIYNEIYEKYGSYFDLRHTTIMSTLMRYMRHRNRILFFCSIPPMVRCKKSLVYFHNLHYAKSFSECLWHLRNKQITKFLKICFYRCWISLFKNNCDYYGCQTTDIANQLAREYKIQPMLLPFFSLLPYRKKERKYDFCYISYPYPHKNHSTLLNAIDILAEKQQFNIILTVPNEQKQSILLKRIDEINNKYGREIIINVGALSRQEVFELYSMSRFLIFPSTLETLGLPLIEAQHCGLKILSSNLAFSHACIENAVTFNPLDEFDISKVMRNALIGKYNDIKQKCLIPNCADKIINIIMN